MTITNLLPIEVACVDIIKVEKIHSALGNTRKCAHFRTYVRLRVEVSKKKKKNSPSSNSSDDDFIASKNGSKQNEHTSPNLKSNPGAKRKARDWGKSLTLRQNISLRNLGRYLFWENIWQKLKKNEIKIYGGLFY